MLEKIKKIVKQNPNKIAYIVDNEKITYKDLYDQALMYSNLLKKEGTSPVIIYGNKELNVVISILSCILSNRTYVPVGKCMPINRIKKIIEMTKSTLVLSDYKLTLDITSNSLDELIMYEDNDINEVNNDIIYIIFTSGSTGIPKGVPISKTNLNNFINWISNIKTLKDYKDINVLNQASFSFDLSVADFYYSLCNGHTLIALNNDIQEEYDKIFEVMKNIDVAVVTPTFIKLCLLNHEFKEEKYSKLKCIYFCGEQLEAKTVKKLFEAFPSVQIINAYGPTEATSAVSAIIITKDMLNDKLLPVGETNNFATDIEIIDDEIVLKGDSVFNGYLDNYIGGYYKEDNINCYKTGDIGYIKDNKLYCKGRIDNQVKYKGYRIELNDIEYNINQIKGVKECAVIAKYDEELIVKTIKAFVIVDNMYDSNYIKNELKKSLPSYMIPKSIEIVDKLPINCNLKLDRKELSKL